MELPLFILSIFTKRTVLQKAKEPFYKRKKIRSTKIKKGIIKKKLLYRNKLPKYERKY